MPSHGRHSFLSLIRHMQNIYTTDFDIARMYRIYETSRRCKKRQAVNPGPGKGRCPMTPYDLLAFVFLVAICIIALKA